VPEDFHPGVYVEEVAYRSKSIPGVPTAIIFLVGVLLGVAAAIALETARRRRLPPTP
jgi:phage tail sheath protein FI